MTTMPVHSITDEQIAELESHCQKFHGFAITSQMVMQMITRLREAEKDASRYRWLRDNWFQVYGTSMGERGIKLEIGDIWNRCGKPSHVDNAIDIAMQGEQ